MAHNQHPQQDAAPDPSEYCNVTRGEFEFWKKAIVQLQQRVDALSGNAPAPEHPKASKYDADMVPRGQYAGRYHSDVVEEDPWHVVWLADNSRAEGLGYDDVHIEKARRLADERPNPRARRR